MKKASVFLVLAIILIALIGCSIVTPATTPTPEIKVTATVKPTNAPTQAPTKKTSTSSSSSSSSRVSFTNKYGTPTTKCAHPGCSNYIASSGDTNCCTTHSKRCIECGKYVDEDATWCMDCIKNAAEQVAQDNGKKCDDSNCSKTASKVLTVTQPSGECASFFLCSSHYSEYKDYFNSKKGWKANQSEIHITMKGGTSHENQATSGRVTLMYDNGEKAYYRCEPVLDQYNRPEQALLQEDKFSYRTPIPQKLDGGAFLRQ